MSKVEEYKRKLEEHEKKAEEEAKLFNIDEFLIDTDKVLEKYVEGVGIIRYKRLTFIEATEIFEKYANDRKRLAIAFVASMLSKADPNVTVEKFEKIPLNIASKIINALAEEIKMDFL